jgi:transcription elongation factor Elf1
MKSIKARKIPFRGAYCESFFSCPHCGKREEVFCYSHDTVKIIHCSCGYKYRVEFEEE